MERVAENQLLEISEHTVRDHLVSITFARGDPKTTAERTHSSCQNQRQHSKGWSLSQWFIPTFICSRCSFHCIILEKVNYDTGSLSQIIFSEVSEGIILHLSDSRARVLNSGWAPVSFVPPRGEDRPGSCHSQLCPRCRTEWHMSGVKWVFVEGINKWVNINCGVFAVLNAISVQHFVKGADLLGHNY